MGVSAYEMNVTKLLQAYIGQQGIQLKDIAIAIGMDNSTLSRVVSAQTVPSPETIAKLLYWLLQPAVVETVIPLEPIEPVHKNRPRRRKTKTEPLSERMRSLVNIPVRIDE